MVAAWGAVVHTDLVWSAQFRAVLRADGVRIIRDQFLIGMVVYILAVVVALRIALPYITARLSPSVDLTAYYPLLASYFAVVLGAVLVGTISGMLLLETREERMLDALRVSPMPVGRMLMFEALSAFVTATVIILLMALILGIGLPSLGVVVVVSMGGAAFAPVVSVALATTARDKVEAFALMKIMGLVALVPVAAWFLPEPWQWAAIVSPPYAATKAWWIAEAGHSGWPLWLALAFVVNGALLAGLIRRF